MNIDEFIEHTKEKAREHRYHADFFESDNPMNTVCIKSAEDCEQLAEWLEKYKEYQQLEEQGRLVKLPCKVGDTVYCIFSRYTKCTPNSEEFDEYNCQGCEYECDSKKENYVQDMKAYSLDWIVTNLKNFGKTVFLTKSEAEAKLKELRGGKNGKIS